MNNTWVSRVAEKIFKHLIGDGVHAGKIDHSDSGPVTIYLYGLNETLEITVDVTNDVRWTKVEDKLPKDGQEVFYYFKSTGVTPGKYYGMSEYGPEFSGPMGFLTGDVTHWMPRTGEDSHDIPEFP